MELAVREATLLIGHDGVVVSSLRAERLLGLDAGALVGGGPLPDGWTMEDETGTELAPEDHPALVALRTGDHVNQELTCISPGGAERHLVRFVAHPLVDDPEIAVDVVVSDPRRRIAARAAIENQTSRFLTVADMVPVAIYEATPTGEITYVNPKFTELTGYTADTAPDLPMMQIVHPDDLLAVLEVAVDAPTSGVYAARYRVLHIDGTFRWARSTLSFMMDADGSLAGFVGTIEDVDELVRAERYANRLADIVESAGDAVIVFEGERLIYLNATATSMLERTDPAFASGPRHHVFGRQFEEWFTDEIIAVLRTAGRWVGDVGLTDAGGVTVDLSLTVTAEFDEHGAPGRVVLMARDIREQKRREAELAHAATHDPLTGLVNRSVLNEAVHQAENAGEAAVAVLFVDIDHFKRINDDHGHAAGDSVLMEVAARLSAIVRAEDLVARVGGDEFVVWAPGLAPADAEALAARLVAVVAETPFSSAQQFLTVTATVGIATGEGTEELIRAADIALYRAKRTGRNRWMASEASAVL